MKKLMSAAFACALLLPTVASAADYTGKTIEFWVPFKEGGGTDTWARALQPFIAEKLPGNPDVIIVNETTGGAIGGSNEFHRRMKPGGEKIFGTTGSVQFPFLLGDKRVRYDYADWAPVLASPIGGMVYLRADSGVKGVDDFATLKDMKLVFGSQAISTLDLVPLLAFEMLGLDVQAVFGMKSRALTRQAIQRNEVNIDYQTTPTYLKHVVPLVEEGEMVPFMSLGALQADGSIGRDPTFPDVPSFPEVYEKVHGKKPSGPAWDSWKAFFTAGYGTQKFIVLPKSSDQDVIDTYRAAMKEVAADPRAQKVLKDELGNYEIIVGDQVVQAMKDATEVPEEAQAWITNWLKEKYNFSN
ncbi:MAG: hypothetical protein VX620_15740 [Pseudomonadota bacterium]|nr:hypothetical protein [Pseudomonadota bacterium]